MFWNQSKNYKCTTIMTSLKTYFILNSLAALEILTAGLVKTIVFWDVT